MFFQNTIEFRIKIFFFNNVFLFYIRIKLKHHQRHFQKNYRNNTGWKILQDKPFFIRLNKGT